MSEPTHISVDFGQYHPLEHWPGTARCRALPGGVRRHLYVAWYFKHRPRIVAPIRRVIYCSRGQHTWMVGGTRQGKVFSFCSFCRAKRLPSEHDLDMIRSDPFFNPDTKFVVKQEDDTP